VINVMIVEDQMMPKKLFEILIKESGRYQLLFSIENASMAEVYCMKHPVQLILMDICTAMGESGLEAAARIKKQWPGIRIIIVTSMPECSFLDRARAAGVDSFWYKDYSRESILEVMDRTMAGESVYPDRTPELKLGLASSYEFTDRELDVLRELTSGDSDKMIAARLNLSVHTVKHYVNTMLEKTGFKSRTELAVTARELGLVIRNY
jgi:DNA-binding NarL/FixJ family response regulator